MNVAAGLQDGNACRPAAAELFLAKGKCVLQLSQNSVCIVLWDSKERFLTVVVPVLVRLGIGQYAQLSRAQMGGDVVM